MTKNIPFSPPYIDETVIAEVVETLSSGWITSGPKVKALEEMLADYVGIDRVVCVNSATSGMMLMLSWFGIGKGDEVIVPAYTYCATALAVLHVGATPVMVDVGRDFNIDAASLRRVINSKTKAIIPVDFGGSPCDYDSINEIVNDDKIKRDFSPSNSVQEKLGRIFILSDAAHSLGAQYQNKKVGTLCDATVFSLHAVKNVTTAEGGAICINFPEYFTKENFNTESIYKDLKLLSLNGQTKDAFTKSQVGGWKYDIVKRGFKINMPDICAAIGLAQMKIYDDKLLDERKRVFDLYSKIFSKLKWTNIPLRKNKMFQSSCHLYPLRIHNINEDRRDKMIQFISQLGISVNVHFIPLPMLTVFKELGFEITDYPQAYKNYSCEISLPIYPQLCDEDVEAIASAVINAYDNTSE